MTKKTFSIISILELIALIGAYLVHYFTKAKMGMARHVVYVNQKIEKNYPIDMIKIVAIILIVSLTIYVLYRLKDKNIKLSIATLISSILFVGFTVFSSASTMRDYYFVGLLFFIVAILQLIKAFLVSRR